MRTVALAYGKDIGPHLRIEEASWFWVTLEVLGDNLPAPFDYLHCRMPEWLAKVTSAIRWGRRDEDGWTDKSLNYRLYRAADWMYGGFGSWRHHRHVGDVPLSVHEVHELFPDADPIFDGDGEDAMNSRPGDACPLCGAPLNRDESCSASCAGVGDG